METINGTESIGWDQTAADAVELAAIGYFIYVDGVRADLPGVSCAAVATAAGFACSARLPSLTPGSHTLELTAFVNADQILESARSAALAVVVTPPIMIDDTPLHSAQELAWPNDLALRTSDGVHIYVERLVDGLNAPADLAFTPDGRLMIAERGGDIRVVQNGVLAAAPALSMRETLGAGGRLLAIAVDPQFDRNGHVFAVYTEPARAGGLMFVLARFRAVSDTLGDRAVLLDGVPASMEPRASLRFGPDAKLYVAFDDGGDDRRAGDRGSFNGKILRLNADGTTPVDQKGHTPVFADGYHSARGLDWDPRSGTAWSADGRLIRAAPKAVFALPPRTEASSIAFYRGALFPMFSNDLFVASESGRHLLRLRVDPHADALPVASDQLLQDVVGGVGPVAIGPEGAIYFGTPDAVGRLVPGAAGGGRLPR